MVILLKSACLLIWLTVMLVLISGTRRSQTGGYHEVPIYLDSENDLEGMIAASMSRLGPRDRLVIYDSCRSGRRHQVVIHRLLRKNPSVLYHQSLPEL